MAEEQRVRRRSLQEYGRYQSQSAPGSPMLMRRQTYVPKSPSSGIEYIQRATDDCMERKHSLEECRFVEPLEPMGSYYVPGHSSPALYPMYSVPSPTMYSMQAPMMQAGYRPVQEVQPYYTLPQSQSIPMAMDNIVYQPVPMSLQQNSNYSAQYKQTLQDDNCYDVQGMQNSMQGLQVQDNCGSQQDQHYQQQHQQQQQQQQYQQQQQQFSPIRRISQESNNSQSGSEQVQQQQQPQQQQQQPRMRRRSGVQSVQQVQNVQMVHPIQLSPTPGRMYSMQGQMMGSSYPPVISRVNHPDTITEHVQMTNAVVSNNNNVDSKQPDSCLVQRRNSNEVVVKKKKVSFEDEPPKRLQIIRVQKSYSADATQVADEELDDNANGDIVVVSSKEDATDGYEPYVALRRASTGSRPHTKSLVPRKGSDTKQRRNSVCPMTAYNLR